MTKASLWLIPLVAVITAWQYATHREASHPSVPVAATLPPADWVDESSCQGCHAQQHGDWQASHHHLAMQVANEGSVLGNFNDAVLNTDTGSSRFFRRDGGFWIRTTGADGKEADFPVAYTFGLAPLQQYLLQMPDGRLQAHGAAWDVPEQRWFHLYDGEGVDQHHRLHWTRAQQNADFMCIECHTTAFKRNFDPVKNSFDAQWLALGVGCQSCHGPASAHLQWAMEEAPVAAGNKGFAQAPEEPETCARCHSRRSPLGDGYTHGNTLLDDYLPVILSADLYEVDGKIKDEVFEYGSFTQSRMHAAGVRCSDCHNPHSGQLRAPGNAVCNQCHNPVAQAIRSTIDSSGLLAKPYDHPSHHHHAAGSPGSQCVNCHMPGKLYMGNDLRHDHSFSSPNPRQASALSHSDACLDCHQNSDAKHIMASFQQWYPDAQPRDGGYARDLHTAREGKSGAAAALLRQLARDELPDIRRATVLSELGSYPSLAAQEEAIKALQHSSPQVRHAAVELLAALASPAHQVRLLPALLNDPVRAVRTAAAWQLLQLSAASQPLSDERQLQEARSLIAEYEQLQNSMQDRAESLLNLAGVYQLTGRQSDVEPTLRRALERDPTFHPAVIMLAQWQEQAMGAPQVGLRLLQENLARYPEEASLHHAHALMLVRQGKRAEALTAFQRAHELAPEHSHYGYVFAVALYDSNQKQRALALLRELLRQAPAQRSVRLALISYLSAEGNRAEVEALRAELAAQNPGDPLLQ